MQVQWQRVEDVPICHVMRLPRGNLGGVLHVQFQVVSGSDLGQVFSADVSAATIGRGSGNLVALSDSKVSRQHARFEVVAGSRCGGGPGQHQRHLRQRQRLASRAPHLCSPATRCASAIRPCASMAWLAAALATPGRSRSSPASARPRWLVPAIAVLALALLVAGLGWLLTRRDLWTRDEAPVVIATPDTPTPVTFRTGPRQRRHRRCAPQAQAAADPQAPGRRTGGAAKARAAVGSGKRPPLGQAGAARPASWRGAGSAAWRSAGPARWARRASARRSAGRSSGAGGQLPGAAQGRSRRSAGRCPAAGPGTNTGRRRPDVPRRAAGAAAAGHGQAAQGGQLAPADAQALIGGLFPGVPRPLSCPGHPEQLPGVPPDQLQAVFNLVFPGQGVSVPGASPLNGRIFYGARTDDDRFQIYQINADGSGQRLVLEDASEVAVSPDRQWLAYYSWRDDQRGLRLHRLSGDGAGEDRTLTTDSNHSYPSWAPDQSRLVFYDYSDNSIQTIAPDGSGSRKIASGRVPGLVAARRPHRLQGMHRQRQMRHHPGQPGWQQPDSADHQRQRRPACLVARWQRADLRLRSRWQLGDLRHQRRRKLAAAHHRPPRPPTACRSGRPTACASHFARTAAAPGPSGSPQASAARPASWLMPRPAPIGSGKKSRGGRPTRNS